MIAIVSASASIVCMLVNKLATLCEKPNIAEIFNLLGFYLFAFTIVICLFKYKMYIPFPLGR